MAYRVSQPLATSPSPNGDDKKKKKTKGLKTVLKQYRKKQRTKEETEEEKDILNQPHLKSLQLLERQQKLNLKDLIL